MPRVLLSDDEKRDVAGWLGEIAASRQVQSRARGLTRQERVRLGFEVRQLLRLIERLDASALESDASLEVRHADHR